MKKKRVIVTLDLEGSPFSPEDIETRLRFAIEAYRMPQFSDFILAILRTSKAKTWGDTTVEVKDIDG